MSLDPVDFPMQSHTTLPQSKPLADAEPSLEAVITRQAWEALAAASKRQALLAWLLHEETSAVSQGRAPTKMFHALGIRVQDEAERIAQDEKMVLELASRLAVVPVALEDRKAIEVFLVEEAKSLRELAATATSQAALLDGLLAGKVGADVLIAGVDQLKSICRVMQCLAAQTARMQQAWPLPSHKKP